jgi:hypothetical protein
LSKVLSKGDKVQRKTIEKETILDHCTSKPNIQGFTQIAIDGNKPKPFVEMMALKRNYSQRV